VPAASSLWVSGDRTGLDGDGGLEQWPSKAMRDVPAGIWSKRHSPGPAAYSIRIEKAEQQKRRGANEIRLGWCCGLSAAIYDSSY
jgi:hypothetical protein